MEISRLICCPTAQNLTTCPGAACPQGVSMRAALSAGALSCVGSRHIAACLVKRGEQQEFQRILVTAASEDRWRLK